MTGNELRKAYLDFFKGKRHAIVPSSSLVPHGDPTLLLTTAGMVQFKPYYLGHQTPPSPRLTSVQKCFRTTDIEHVGDPSHLTFFEMLGNFSIGDYFKRESIFWAWEFVTEVLKLPKEKLWATVYSEDDEAYNIWKEEIGVPEERIARCGAKDNFWGPAGDSGPCGPCSEIHYDFGLDKGCGKEGCDPSCSCSRFCEVWNLVFVQFNQDKEGNRENLPNPSIDTGMGLERTAAIVQGKETVYETDIFAPILEKVALLTSKKYGVSEADDIAMRVVAEHGRAVTFLIADGVMPSNEGRGYVLKRLLRRAVLFGRRIGLEEPFLAEICEVTIENMGDIYPELKKKKTFIFEVVTQEETRFDETLSSGLGLLENLLSGALAGKDKVIKGTDAFKLYDTYGFPIELTKEVAAERGVKLDMQGFEEEMSKQRERARSARQDVIAIPGTAELKLKTYAPNVAIFSGYNCFKNEQAKVIDVIEGEKGEASVILDSTPFYAEMGGQVGDTGEIRAGESVFAVIDTVKSTGGITIHKGRFVFGKFEKGDVVTAEVDVERRLDIERNHTATHLLQAALRQILGEHVQQKGSIVEPDRLRFDFSHIKPLSEVEIKKIEDAVNGIIRSNLAVAASEMEYKQAIAEGALAFFGDKYTEKVRVLKVGGENASPESVELCGGTHVRSTGEIGYFHIASEGSIGSGIRRIEAVTGRGASTLLRGEKEELGKKIISLEEVLAQEVKTKQALEAKLAVKEAENLLSKVEDICGVSVLLQKIPSSSVETMRQMTDFIKDKKKSVIILLAAVNNDKPFFLSVVTDDLVAKGYHAGSFIKQAAGVTGGGGGGSPNMAQGGGRDKTKLAEALNAVREVIKANAG